MGGLGKHGITGEYHPERVRPFPRFLTRVFGTGLGTGYFPAAHGTAASLLFVLLWVWLVPDVQWIEVLVAVAITLISVPLSHWGELMYGPDPGRITVDEFAGQAVALLFLPARTWPWLLAAFVLFRFFDVLKLKWTREHVETLPYGWGVTLDDTLAGVFAWIILQVAALVV